MKNLGGLLDRDWQYISDALAKCPEIERAVLFGSRALGNYKVGSDVDLAVIGASVGEKTLINLHVWLNEWYPLPYVFDLLDVATISNENLRTHIDTFGKEVYVRRP